MIVAVWITESSVNTYIWYGVCNFVFSTAYHLQLISLTTRFHYITPNQNHNTIQLCFERLVIVTPNLFRTKFTVVYISSRMGKPEISLWLLQLKSSLAWLVALSLKPPAELDLCDWRLYRLDEAQATQPMVTTFSDTARRFHVRSERLHENLRPVIVQVLILLLI